MVEHKTYRSTDQTYPEFILPLLEIIERANRTSFYEYAKSTRTRSRMIIFTLTFTAAEIKKIKAKNRAEVEIR